MDQGRTRSTGSTEPEMRRDIFIMIALSILDLAEKIIGTIFHNSPSKDAKRDE